MTHVAMFHEQPFQDAWSWVSRCIASLRENRNLITGTHSHYDPAT